MKRMGETEKGRWERYYEDNVSSSYFEFLNLSDFDLPLFCAEIFVS